MSSSVRLPVLRLLEITGYPMYPGDNPTGEGFARNLVSGVNVIVGVNGLGKTTLVKILFRTLVGPYDPTKADLLEPGAKLHRRTQLKRFDYFAARIGSDARKARVTVEMAFDEDVLRIVRSLGPSLDVVELRLNNVILDEPGEERYVDVIREVSGIDSDYDWDFVVRNLMFFMEEKVPLIWNPKGQFRFSARRFMIKL